MKSQFYLHAVSFTPCSSPLPPCRQAYHWDLWVRWDSNRLGRECVIPDVSRTFHAGMTGSHITHSFSALYYQDHAFNEMPDVQLKNVNR